MNKVLQSCMIALAATTLFSACQKDNEHLVDLTAVIVDQPVSNAKVYIDGIYGCWQHGDAVKIKSGSNGTESYSLTVAGSGEAATRATIPDVTEGTPYTAGYPGGNTTITGNGTLTIDVPASQSYAEAAIYSGAETVKQRIVCPMAAYSPDGSDLKFYNVAAMLAVTVTNSESSALTLYAVEVESDKSPLSGTASVSVDANGAAITGTSGTSQSVTLTFGTTVTLAGSESRTVYIPVLPIGDSEGEKSTLTVHVKATANADGSGSKYTFHDESSSSISIESNQIGNVPVTLDVDDPETAVNDYFWGQGTEDCPFLIENQADLENLRTVTNAGTSGYIGNTVYYKQIADIELSSWTTGIGTSSHIFAANYDGGGHSISEFSVSAGSAYGLFVYAGGGSISNVTTEGTMTGTSTTDYEGVGGIVGKATATLAITACTNNVSIVNGITTNTLVPKTGFGGICGVATGAVTITDCVNNGTVSLISSGSSARNMPHGGILGYNENAGTTILRCKNTAAISQNRTDNPTVNFGKVGGICGATLTNIDISYCENSGAISNNGSSTDANVYVMCGGILGEVFESNNTSSVTLDAVSVTHCTNTGDVTCNNSSSSYKICGGIIGNIGGRNCTNLVVHVTLADNTNQANITAKTRAGGMLGYINTKNTSSFSVSGCKTLGSANTITATSGYAAGILGYLGNINNTSARLSITNCKNESAVTGTGYVAGILSYITAGAASGWLVIENCENTGTITSTGNYAGGIVGQVVYHPLKLSNCSNSGVINASANYNGGLIGSSNQGTKIENCSNTETVTGANYTGGIAGYAVKDTMTNCTNSAEISGTYHVGGLVGSLSNACFLTSCENSAAITGSATGSSAGVAGIAGSAPGALTIDQCRNTGDVHCTFSGNSTQLYVGGLIGYSNGTFTATNCGCECDVTMDGGCYATGGFFGSCRVSGSTMKNCYYKGNVTANHTATYVNSVGGMIGGTYNTSSVKLCTLTNCYFDGTITTQKTGNYVGDMYAKYNTTGYYCTITNCYARNTYGSNTHATTTFDASGNLATAQTINGASRSTLYDALHNWYLLNTTYSDWKNETVPHLAWED